MNDEIPYNPPGLDAYIAEGARKNGEMLRRMTQLPDSHALPDMPLPCPFCGSEKITVEWEPCAPLDATDTNRRWFAECTQCSCQGPFCQKEPQVLTAWNKRPS